MIARASLVGVLLLSALLAAGCLKQPSAVSSPAVQVDVTMHTIAPESALIQVQLRRGDTKEMDPVGVAEVTFESESGTPYQVTSDPDGKAEIRLPAVPVTTATGGIRCTSYRVTVSAPTYKITVIESIYLAPWADTIYLDAPVVKGSDTLHITQTGERCVPDQRPAGS